MVSSRHNKQFVSIRQPPNYVIALDKRQYQAFAGFINERKCSIDYGEDAPINPLRVSEYLNEKQLVLCVVSVDKVCGYLLEVFSSLCIKWNDQKLRDFQMLVNEYDCPSVQCAIELKKKINKT